MLQPAHQLLQRVDQLLPLRAVQRRHLVFERERRPAGDPRQVAAELLARVQLQEHAATYPQFLPGGQKQRVAIARARPDVLLLDELTARRLWLLMQELWMDNAGPRPTGILVTHNMMEAAFLADRIYVMGHPGAGAHFSAVIDVDIPRARDPEDPALFEVHGQIMKALTH
ncbi:ATP-binding cassette domain-containing protein [Comamonas antarctica]|uniref:ATP-binding cassette domain-containing protein n=1 Tax=Comamonas antarctica TaxID=2743470 RepID=A0A6N1XCA5_9BURK|nr:ATP-binding cassette domain-containing protein [Comamonas antarctica]QKV55480.1 ATP-binding cassette domain-containing protein [Comamonas antarctica]